MQDGEQIMEAIDPMQFIQYRLYRFATKYKDGHYIRDISKLNRDPAKVIVLAVDKDYQNADDVMLKVRPWKGDPDDHFMSSSIDLLEGTFLMPLLLNDRKLMHCYLRLSIGLFWRG